MGYAHISALAIGALGLGVVAASAFMMLKARASAKWPTAEGKVVVSTVGESRYKGQVTYVARVTYTYSVAGKSYTSQQRGVGAVVGQSAGAAQSLAARYREGMTVWVFYNPRNPADAVLEHVAPAAMVWMTAGILVVMFAVWRAVNPGGAS